MIATHLVGLALRITQPIGPRTRRRVQHLLDRAPTTRPANLDGLVSADFVRESYSTTCWYDCWHRRFRTREKFNENTQVSTQFGAGQGTITLAMVSGYPRDAACACVALFR